MTPAEAERLTELVQAGWDWLMPTQTFEIWVQALGGLRDPQAVEDVIFGLVKTLTRRPLVGDVTTAYAQRRKHDETPDLPALDEPRLPREESLTRIRELLSVVKRPGGKETREG